MTSRNLYFHYSCRCSSCSIIFLSISLLDVDVGNSDAALELFDSVLVERLKTGVIFALVDAASLLWRMEVSKTVHRPRLLLVFCSNSPICHRGCESKVWHIVMAEIAEISWCFCFGPVIFGSMLKVCSWEIVCLSTCSWKRERKSVPPCHILHMCSVVHVVSWL